MGNFDGILLSFIVGFLLGNSDCFLLSLGD